MQYHIIDMPWFPAEHKGDPETSRVWETFTTPTNPSRPRRSADRGEAHFDLKLKQDIGIGTGLERRARWIGKEQPGNSANAALAADKRSTEVCVSQLYLLMFRLTISIRFFQSTSKRCKAVRWFGGLWFRVGDSPVISPNPSIPLVGLGRSGLRGCGLELFVVQYWYQKTGTTFFCRHPSLDVIAFLCV